MQRGEIMKHNVPLARQGRMHPWGPDSDVLYTHDSSSVYAGRLAANRDTNEPRRSPSPPCLGTGVAGATWEMAGRAVAVDLSSGTLGCCSCAADSGNQGVMNHMEMPFVIGLSVKGSCTTSESE